MWHVDSVSGSTPQGYCVIRSQVAPCTECEPKGKICAATECKCLCIHMYRCDSRCYSYNNGHICKHIHRVHSLSQIKQPATTIEATQESPDGMRQQCDSVDEGYVMNNEVELDDYAVNDEVELDDYAVNDEVEPNVVYGESVSNPQRGICTYYQYTINCRVLPKVYRTHWDIKKRM